MKKPDPDHEDLNSRFRESGKKATIVENISIKNWSQDDRPREKLMQKGRMVLSNAELIAILIGSGSRKESAVSLSQRILASVDNQLNALGKLHISQLMKFKGIGEAKAITIAAALELGRRRRTEDALERKKVNTSEAAFELLQPILGELPHEEFWVVYLDNGNKVIQVNQLSKGGLTGTLVDVRPMMRLALEVRALAVILAHNHPSGTLRASSADKALTKKIRTAATALDIKVLDHLIITEHSYYSFADDGLL